MLMNRRTDFRFGGYPDVQPATSNDRVWAHLGHQRMVFLDARFEPRRFLADRDLRAVRRLPRKSEPDLDQVGSGVLPERL